MFSLFRFKQEKNLNNYAHCHGHGPGECTWCNCSLCIHWPLHGSKACQSSLDGRSRATQPLPPPSPHIDNIEHHEHVVCGPRRSHASKNRYTTEKWAYRLDELPASIEIKETQPHFCGGNINSHGSYHTSETHVDLGRSALTFDLNLLTSQLTTWIVRLQKAVQCKY